MVIMIDDKNKIHYIRNIKTLTREILRQLEQYHDPKRFLGWSKKKRKYVLKKFRKR